MSPQQDIILEGSSTKLLMDDDYILPSDKTINDLKQERKATLKGRLEDLGGKPLPELLSHLREQNVGTLAWYLEIVTKNPTTSGMLETTIKQVISEKENGGVESP
jgi:hypothetical protein